MSSHIAFLGAGRMASAIVDGLLANSSYPRTHVACLSGSGKSAEALAERTGIRRADTLESLLDGADLLVVAFKPQHLAGANPRLVELTKGKLVLSILASKTLGHLEKTFPHTRNLVRTMPNTPSAIGAGMTGWCALRPLSEGDHATVLRLLEAMGRHVEISEAQIDALMAISGCGPAYVFEFAAALREAGVTAGLDRATSHMLSVETILGAARLLARTGAEPEDLRNQVTSPNGTTSAGLKRMEAGNFRGMIKETVLAAQARSFELSREG